MDTMEPSPDMLVGKEQLVAALEESEASAVHCRVEGPDSLELGRD